MEMETVAEGSQDRRLWTQTHRQQRRLHEAVAADVESQNTRATTGRSVTAKYRLPSYSSYNEICLGRVNIATARGKLRRQAAKWRTVATVAVQNLRYSWGFRQEAP